MAEIVLVAADSVKLSENAASFADRSSALTSYPTDLSLTPPQVLQKFRSMGSGLRRYFSEQGVVISGDCGSRGLSFQPDEPEGCRWDLLLLGMLVAFGLGAAHALSPGHGKTMVERPIWWVLGAL